MKKALIYTLLISVISISFVCASCEYTAKNEIEQTVMDYFKEFNEYDFIECENYFLFDENEVFFLGLNDEQFEIYRNVTEYTSIFMSFFIKSASETEYKIISSSETQDGGTVTIEVSYPDGDGFITKVFTNFYHHVLASSLNGIELGDREEIIASIVSDIYKNDPLKTKTIEFDVTLTKTNDGLRILPCNELYMLYTFGAFNDLEAIDNSFDLLP